jgi:pimeloyl-ACP methyl ester carboxylesterase
MVRIQGWISNLDYDWEYPQNADLLHRLGRFTRLIRFDKRGTGLSDRDVGFPTLEQRMDDVRAVMDAARSERAILFGSSEGGNMSLLFAATYPERTTALILHGCQARGTWAPDYPWAPTRDQLDAQLVAMRREWEGGAVLYDGAPSLAGDKAAQEWMSAYCRQAASPGTAHKMWELGAMCDVRDILSSIRVPTLVLQKTGDRWVKPEEGRYLAEHIPGARYVEMPGSDHVLWGDGRDRLVQEIEEFVTGVRPPETVERSLLTLLFTDIVGSTQMAADMGDQRWKMLLQAHDDAVRGEIRRFGGSEVKNTGDGFLISFDGPTPAVACARAITARAARLGLKIRSAIHTGECERRSGDLGGIAVHLAARLLDHADGGETTVSRTVRDLMIGANETFKSRGVTSLSGIPGEWELFSVAS